MAINRAMGPAEWLLLVALSVLWGRSFFFSEVALAELPPFTVVLGRVGLAAVALVVMVLASGQRLWRRAGPGPVQLRP
jgi:drug/metabolite transporter (DMT)-like permease